MENIGETFKVRVTTYKSIRHYGGRDITEYVHIVSATLVALQRGDQPYIVTLNEDVKNYNGKLVYPRGHKIAISKRDFNL